MLAGQGHLIHLPLPASQQSLKEAGDERRIHLRAKDLGPRARKTAGAVHGLGLGSALWPDSRTWPKGCLKVSRRPRSSELKLRLVIAGSSALAGGWNTQDTRSEAGLFGISSSFLLKQAFLSKGQL